MKAVIIAIVVVAVVIYTIVAVKKQKNRVEADLNRKKKNQELRRLEENDGEQKDFDKNQK